MYKKIKFNHTSLLIAITVDALLLIAITIDALPLLAHILSSGKRCVDVLVVGVWWWCYC